MSLDLLEEVKLFKVAHLPGEQLQIRIGNHTGPCCAGIHSYKIASLIANMLYLLQL